MVLPFFVMWFYYFLLLNLIIYDFFIPIICNVGIPYLSSRDETYWGDQLNTKIQQLQHSQTEEQTEMIIKNENDQNILNAI